MFLCGIYNVFRSIIYYQENKIETIKMFNDKFLKKKFEIFVFVPLQLGRTKNNKIVKVETKKNFFDFSLVYYKSSVIKYIGRTFRCVDGFSIMICD